MFRDGETARGRGVAGVLGGDAGGRWGRGGEMRATPTWYGAAGGAQLGTLSVSIVERESMDTTEGLGSSLYRRTE